MTSIPMKMATVNDGRLLKIIHPGGRIDFYDRPVTAKEIMNQHPKDFIARPDVFRVPWFVVSPEATLMPGMQFLVVPKHTIKQLLKKHVKSNRSSATRDNTTTDTRTDPVLKESPNSASKRSATVHPDQQKVNHESFSNNRSCGVKMGCVPSASQSIAKLKVSSQQFVTSVSKLNKTKQLKVSFFQIPQNTHSTLPPPTPTAPQIHPPDEAPDSSIAARTKRRVTFKLPTAEDIYYIPAHDSPDRDANTARPVS